ncbi:MAG: hypothetical protein ACLP50_02790 [Solirubrobacteraceae bacterium]
MITNSPYTNAATHRPAEVGSGTLPVHTPSRDGAQSVVRTRRSGSFADGMTARADSAERTAGSFAIGMAIHPDRSRARTGCFADGLTAVSERSRVRIGSFADGMTARGLGDGVARGADFAPGVSPAWGGVEDAVYNSTSSVAQDAIAA